jgi:hypothetical protein
LREGEVADPAVNTLSGSHRQFPFECGKPRERAYLLGTLPLKRRRWRSSSGSTLASGFLREQIGVALLDYHFGIGRMEALDCRRKGAIELILPNGLIDQVVAIGVHGQHYSTSPRPWSP